MPFKTKQPFAKKWAAITPRGIPNKMTQARSRHGMSLKRLKPL